jgi:hypothetical protein
MSFSSNDFVNALCELRKLSGMNYSIYGWLKVMEAIPESRRRIGENLWDFIENAAKSRLQNFGFNVDSVSQRYIDEMLYVAYTNSLNNS